MDAHLRLFTVLAVAMTGAALPVSKPPLVFDRDVSYYAHHSQIVTSGATLAIAVG